MNTVINHPVLGADLDLAGRPTFSSSSNPHHPIYWHPVFQICKKSSVFSKEKVMLLLKSKCGRKLLCGSSSVCYIANYTVHAGHAFCSHAHRLHLMGIVPFLIIYTSYMWMDIDNMTMQNLLHFCLAASRSL